MARRALIAAAPIAAALALLGCGGGTPRPGAAATAGDESDGPRSARLDEQEIQRILTTVTAARQLPERWPIDVVVVDPVAFEQHHFALQPRVWSGPTISPEEALLVGFDFIPPRERRGVIPTPREIARNDVDGFYAIAADRIFLPRRPAATAEEHRIQRVVLAHEIQHALQSRHFPEFRALEPAGADENLARAALLEGDAEVTMAAFMALEGDRRVGHELRRVLRSTRTVPLGKDEAPTEGEVLAAALPITKERRMFPYEDGALFVADLYRAGGFPLVNRAYAQPPSTTEHILHPEKYFAGERPREVHPFTPPPGFTLVHTEGLGELQARTLLRRCAATASDGDAAAAGWDGDRYAVFTSATGELGVGWVSAWDTEQDAREVETSLSARGDCWSTNGVGRQSAALTIGAEVEVHRDGDVVVLARGIPRRDRTAWMAAIRREVGPRPPAKPWSDVAYVPRAPLPEPQRGRVSGDVWSNPWLGLDAKIPAGARVRPDGADLQFRTVGLVAAGSIRLQARVFTPRSLERTWRELGASLAESASGAGLRTAVVRTGPVATPLGRGVERVWRELRTPLETRVIVIPICAESGAIVITQQWGDPAARRLVDTWLAGVRWTGDRRVPACEFLDPK